MKVEAIGKSIKVLMTPLAYTKMQFIVETCEAEVAWRGAARRLNDNEFLIEDVFLLKQTVTGTSVDIKAEDNIEAILQMERAAGIKLDEMNDRGLYFHGHSHVNMGVSPSSVDEGDRQRTIDTNVPFYIWMIWNKKNDISCCVYLNLNTEEEEIVVGGKEAPKEKGPKPLVSGLLFRDVPFDIYISEDVKAELKADIDRMVTTSIPVRSYGNNYFSGAYEKAVSKIKGKAAKKHKASESLIDYGDAWEDYYGYIETAEDGVPVIKESDPLAEDGGAITLDDLWIAAEAGTLDEKDLEKLYASNKLSYTEKKDLLDINRAANTKAKSAYWPAPVRTRK